MVPTLLQGKRPASRIDGKHTSKARPSVPNEPGASARLRVMNHRHVALRIHANYVEEADHSWWGAGVFAIAVT